MPWPPSRQRGLVRGLLVAGFFVAVTLVFFKPTVIDDGTFSTVGAVQRVYFPWQATHENGLPFYPQSDQAQSSYPRQVFIDGAVDDGVLPSWDPYTLAGHPYLSNGGNSFFYPPRQLVTRAAGPAIAHDLYLMFHMAVAGCTAYFLLRTLRMSTAGSLLGGLAWMWNPFLLSWAQLELLPPVMAWLPLALALVHRAHHRRSWPARLGAGASCGLMILGGSLDLAMAASGVVGLYAAAIEVPTLWRRRRDAGWPGRLGRMVGRVAAVPAVAVGIGAPALVPFGLLSPRFARTPLDYDIFYENVTVPLSTFAQFWWRPDFPFTDTTMHRMAFVGTPIAVLALIGLFQRRAGTGLARGLLLGSILVLGRTPLAAAFDAVSVSYRFLSLGRFMFCWALGLIILAIAGFDRVAALVTGGPILVEDTSEALPDPLAMLRPSGWRVGRRGILVLGGAALVLAVTGAQLFRYGRAINADFIPRDRSFLFPTTPALDALVARGSEPAADRNLPILRPGLQPLPDSSIPMVFPYESAAGYDSSLPSTIADLWRVVQGEPVEQVTARGLSSGLVTLFYTDRTRFDLLPRLGITSVIGPPDLEEEPGWDEAGRNEQGLATVYEGIDAEVLEVEAPAPRAYVVYDVEAETSPHQALARFTEPAFPWRSTAIIDGEVPPTDPDSSSGAAEEMSPALVRVHDLDRVEVDVTADAPGYLVLLDSFDEGWTATVDGEEAEVHRANAAFRAVAVPSGTSTVVFRYETPGLREGWAMAGVTLVVTAVAGTAAFASTARTRRVLSEERR